MSETEIYLIKRLLAVCLLILLPKFKVVDRDHVRSIMNFTHFPYEAAKNMISPTYVRNMIVGIGLCIVAIALLMKAGDTGENVIHSAICGSLIAMLFLRRQLMADTFHRQGNLQKAYQRDTLLNQAMSTILHVEIAFIVITTIVLSPGL